MPNISSAGWARSRTIGRGGHRIEYIGVHYTATRASANANCRYFASRATGASAHYFVDGSHVIWQSVPDGDTAYAVGNWVANQRSISIEVVSAGEDFSESEIQDLAWIVQRLMRQYGVPASKVVRHYDFASIGFPGSWASPHKLCPRPYIDAAKWAALHARITGGEEIDMTDEQARQLAFVYDHMRWQDGKGTFSDLGNLVATQPITYKNAAGQDETQTLGNRVAYIDQRTHVIEQKLDAVLAALKE